MKKINLKLLSKCTILFLILLTSCSQSLQYSLIDKHRLNGTYLLKKFTYNISNSGVEANNQLKVKNDETEFFVVIEKDINVYFTESLSAELNASGMILDWQAKKVFVGSIEKILIDKSNDKTSIEITVNYKIIQDNKIIDNYSETIKETLIEGATIGKEDYNSILEETTKLAIDDYCKHLKRTINK